MKRREVELLYAYIVNNHDRLEQELQELQTRIRYRRIDAVDCFELALAIERYNTFCVIAHDIRALLNLRDCEYEKENGAGG